jgi:hypothetical protein
MVAAKWEWTSAYIFATLGWKAAVAVLVNAALVTFFFRRELQTVAAPGAAQPRVPAVFVMINLVLLAGVVVGNHDPEVFMGAFLVFLGLTEAYRRHHDRLLLREGLMVAFFLAGLVVLGGLQRWWLQPALSSLDESALFFGAVALTAVTDNAALTYLGSLVDGISGEYKYALVAGAVAGGGLTVIANAPNPAGFAILKDSFEDRAISALWLFVAALAPTAVAILCFRVPGSHLNEIFDLAVVFLLALPFVVAAIGLWAERTRKK